MNRYLDEKLDNSYLVKRRLSTLRKLPGDRCFQFNIGDFQIRLLTNAEFSDPPNKELERVTDYEAVTLEIWEESTSTPKYGSYSAHYSAMGVRVRVELTTDPRFADFYSELRYTRNQWDYQNGKLMPIPIVCDLIKHVDRINELVAFQ